MNHEVITNALNENEKLLIDKLEKMEAEINKKDQELSSKEKRLVSSESNINVEIGNAKITIPVSETTLINSIIKELLERC